MSIYQKQCSVPECKGTHFGNGYCAKHYTRVRRYGSTDLPKTKRELLLAEGEYQCSKCKHVKPINAFNKDKHTKSGLAAYCKKCSGEKSSTRYHENPDKHYNSRVKHDFGMDLNGYTKLLDSQDGGCAICSKPPMKQRLSIDHDHNTGKIRGLLCTSCNLALGYFHDDRKLLVKAIEYLEL
jgi:hypothetical protein